MSHIRLALPLALLSAPALAAAQGQPDAETAYILIPAAEEKALVLVLADGAALEKAGVDLSEPVAVEVLEKLQIDHVFLGEIYDSAAEEKAFVSVADLIVAAGGDLAVKDDALVATADISLAPGVDAEEWTMFRPIWNPPGYEAADAATGEGLWLPVGALSEGLGVEYEGGGPLGM